MVFYIVIPLKKLLSTLIKTQLQFLEKFVSVQYQATNVHLTELLIGAYIGLAALNIIYVKTSLIALNNAGFASYAITYALILLRISVKNFLFHLMCAMAALMSISVF
jgi:hypothetical protein